MTTTAMMRVPVTRPMIRVAAGGVFDSGPGLGDSLRGHDRQHRLRGANSTAAVIFYYPSACPLFSSLSSPSRALSLSPLSTLPPRRGPVSALRPAPTRSRSIPPGKLSRTLP
eukprot:460417-Rhodomonas_salina.5